MDYLSVLSLTAAILYFFVGFHTLRANRKSYLCIIFFILNLSMTVWSFGDAFMYLAKNDYEYSFWNKIAAFGWCTFEALVLYFVLVLIENKHIRHWYVKLLVIFPAFVSLLMALFLFGPDIDTKPSIRNFFYYGNFLYNFTYLAVSILMIFLWGYRSTSLIRRKQAFLIATCSITPFLLNLVVQYILPALHIVTLPYIGQLFTLIMLLGVYHAITKYQFMSIPSSLVMSELFHELIGLTFLTDSHGQVMRANKQAYELLSYREDEFLGKSITDILKHSDIKRIIESFETLPERVRLKGIEIYTKTGTPIPVHLTIIPLFINDGLLGGVLFVGEDIRSTRLLKDEIEKHRITNEKLRNSEMMFRNILEMAPVSIVLSSSQNGVLLYMNSHAEQLFEEDGNSVIGHSIFQFLQNREDRHSLINVYHKVGRISNREIRLLKKDGSAFTGLITVIPSIYHEEKVDLSCIIDITDQKRVEEKLKLNNECINQLNKDLMLMNIDLMNKSIRDGLTNLYSHQHINEVLDIRMQKASATGENLCLMMIDIDHFKKVNDSYGHLVGDMVLQVISDLLVSNTRAEDLAGRYGGEEFIVILSGIGLEAAVGIAENIRLAVYDYDYGVEGLKVSISIGLAQYEDETLSAFINKADMLLYQAKTNGRNRCSF